MNVMSPLSPALEAFLARGNSDTSEALRENGLPNARVEAWRYTPLRAVTGRAYDVAPDGQVSDVRRLLERAWPEGLEAACLVFVNGRFVEEFSALPKDAEVSRFAGEFGSVAQPERDAITALNAALAEDGICIRVPRDVDAGRVALVSIQTGPGRFSSHVRHRVVVEEGARLSLLDLNIGEGDYLSNPVFEIIVGERARFTHAKVQDEAVTAAHLGLVYADVATDGLYDSFTLTLGAGLARHEVHAGLFGRHSTVHVNGAQLVDGSRHADLTSVITHASPDCNSRQTVKNVLLESGHGVFQGKIYVDRVAQKTDGYQMNQALLLSDSARIDSKPELEIYADDVKCSHGATVGALDEEQVFYLRSRGVPMADARSMLVQAFLLDAVELIEDEALRSVLDRGVEGWWERRAS